MDNLECKKPDRCYPPKQEKEIYPPATEEFDLCVGDFSLHWNGTRAKAERVRHTVDGVYTSVTVINGCIVGYGYSEEPTYTPPYCNPNPSSCQDGGGNGGSGNGGSVSVNISNEPDNIVSKHSNGLFARCYINVGTGLSILGTGTLHNPYTISIDSSGNTVATRTVVGRNGVKATTTPDGVTFVELDETGVKSGIYDITDQFTVDSYGRITNVEPRKEPIVEAGLGLESRTDGDTLVIEHPKYEFADTVVFGAYETRYNISGHLVSLDRKITLDAAVYNLGCYNVGINSFGSVYSIEQRDDMPYDPGVFMTSDGKKVSYDGTGRITSVKKENNTGGGGSNPAASVPLPIRDMCKLTYRKDNNDTDSKYKFESEIYGKVGPIRHRDIAGERKIYVKLPDYITSEAAVDVNGATSLNGNKLYSFDWINRELVIDALPDLCTVVFRG